MSIQANTNPRTETQPPPTDRDFVPQEPLELDASRFQRPNDTMAPDETDIKKKIEQDLFRLARSRDIPVPSSLTAHPMNPASPRMPKPVQALYLTPLKRPPKYNIPTATLQLRSYSARNLEFMADFALRAAYYLNLPAKGPVPMPRITERFTVPRSVFVHKKAQENWERVTLRRMIQIVDGEPSVIQRWLAFVRKWSWYGVGMKANIWEYEALPEQLSKEEREARQKEEIERGMETVDWSLFGRRKGMEGEKEVAQLLERQGFGAGTISEALKAVGGDGAGAFSAQQLREGEKVRRTMDREGDVSAFRREMTDLGRPNRQMDH
ncbi:MAG: hypothetical protein Q9162_002368 [Coniocarpon cinnabarinum]